MVVLILELGFTMAVQYIEILKQSTRQKIFSTDTYTHVQGCININSNYEDYYEKIGYKLKPCYIGGAWSGKSV